MQKPSDLDFGKSFKNLRRAHWLFEHCYQIYSPLYRIYKRRQDAYLHDLIRDHLAPGDVAIDIGANVGAYTEILAEAVGLEGQVHAFEPDNTNFDRLASRLGHRSGITLHKRAVSDSTGKAMFYRSPDLNVDHRLDDDRTGRESAEVDVVSVDDLFGEERSIDFIKMDIQGHEPSALRGMSRTISNSSRIVISTECWPYGLCLSGSSAIELIQNIEALGFDVSIVDVENKCLLAPDLIDWEPLALEPETDFNLWCVKKGA